MRGISQAAALRAAARADRSYNKAVEQIDVVTGEIVATFPSQSDAERQLKVSSGNISSVCHGKRDIAYGYFWRFKGSGRLPAQPKATHPKPVQQLDMATGKVVATFASQSEAERALNVSAGNISSVCHGKRESAYGYIWRFKDSTADTPGGNGGNVSKFNRSAASRAAAGVAATAVGNLGGARSETSVVGPPSTAPPSQAVYFAQQLLLQAVQQTHADIHAKVQQQPGIKQEPRMYDTYAVRDQERNTDASIDQVPRVQTVVGSKKGTGSARKQAKKRRHHHLTKHAPPQAAASSFDSLLHGADGSAAAASTAQVAAAAAYASAAAAAGSSDVAVPAFVPVPNFERDEYMADLGSVAVPAVNNDLQFAQLWGTWDFQSTVNHSFLDSGAAPLYMTDAGGGGPADLSDDDILDILELLPSSPNKKAKVAVINDLGKGPAVAAAAAVVAAVRSVPAIGVR